LNAKLPKNGQAGKVHKMKWPFQRSEIAKAIDIIERHKPALTIKIALENL